MYARMHVVDVLDGFEQRRLQCFLVRIAVAVAVHGTRIRK
jgi:hypothetical protein